MGDGHLPNGQSFLAPKTNRKKQTVVDGRSSHEPTIIRGFSQPAQTTKNTVQPYGFTVFLVEATGFEPDRKSLKFLINKGFSFILRQHFVNFLYTNALFLRNKQYDLSKNVIKKKEIVIDNDRRVYYNLIKNFYILVLLFTARRKYVQRSNAKRA
jgi:hypothetical protein